MVEAILYIFGLVVAVGAALMAAFHDSRAFKIPNNLAGLVLIGFGLAMAVVLLGADVPFAPLYSHLISLVLMFLITLALFGARLIGAGDAKLASSLAVWFGVGSGLPMFIFYTSLVGGVLGLTTLGLKKWRPWPHAPKGTWLASAQAGENRVPYGIAIAAGFVMTAYMLGYFDIVGIMKNMENGG
jgi:prepilin peptidase CpaA